MISTTRDILSIMPVNATGRCPLASLLVNLSEALKTLFARKQAQFKALVQKWTCPVFTPSEHLEAQWTLRFKRHRPSFDTQLKSRAFLASKRRENVFPKKLALRKGRRYDVREQGGKACHMRKDALHHEKSYPQVGFLPFFSPCVGNPNHRCPLLSSPFLATAPGHRTGTISREADLFPRLAVCLRD
jgi:hypothetical protein